MRTALERIFSTDTPPRDFATVTAILPDGSYKVVDDLLRQTTVDGPVGYLPGTQVTIQAGRIVGTGNRKPISKTVRV